MRKSLGVVFVVLIGFVATGCATGGYLGSNPYPGPLGRAMAGSLALTCPGDYFVGPPINQCLRQLGGNTGRYSSYPMYRGGVGGVQLSQADKLAVFCGLGGSGLAAILDAGIKKTVGAGLLSAASCEVAGAVMVRRGNKSQRDNGTIVTPPPDDQRAQGRQSVYWSHGAPVAVGTRPNAGMQEAVRPVIEKRSGEFTLSNSTRFKMDVYDGETGKEGKNFQFRLAPGEKRGVDAPEDRYRGLALVPNVHGNISTEEFGVSPTDAGWIFIEPEVMRGR